MNLKEFDYELPDSLIAAFPSREREGSRLLVIRRVTGEIIHSVFSDLGNFLDAGDLLFLRILIIDDESSLRQVLRIIL